MGTPGEEWMEFPWEDPGKLHQGHLRRRVEGGQRGGVGEGGKLLQHDTVSSYDNFIHRGGLPGPAILQCVSMFRVKSHHACKVLSLRTAPVQPRFILLILPLNKILIISYCQGEEAVHLLHWQHQEQVGQGLQDHQGQGGDGKVSEYSLVILS